MIRFYFRVSAVPSKSSHGIGEPGASAAEDDSEAVSANTFLLSEVIPAFAKAIDSLSIKLTSSHDISTEMHRAGSVVHRSSCVCVLSVCMRAYVSACVCVRVSHVIVLFVATYV